MKFASMKHTKTLSLATCLRGFDAIGNQLTIVWAPASLNTRHYETGPPGI
jgi:hypothetical protein